MEEGTSCFGVRLPMDTRRLARVIAMRRVIAASFVLVILGLPMEAAAEEGVHDYRGRVYLDHHGSVGLRFTKHPFYVNKMRSGSFPLHCNHGTASFHISIPSADPLTDTGRQFGVTSR